MRVIPAACQPVWVSYRVSRTRQLRRCQVTPWVDAPMALCHLHAAGRVHRACLRQDAADSDDARVMPAPAHALSARRRPTLDLPCYRRRKLSPRAERLQVGALCRSGSRQASRENRPLCEGRCVVVSCRSAARRVLVVLATAIAVVALIATVPSAAATQTAPRAGTSASQPTSISCRYNGLWGPALPGGRQYRDKHWLRLALHACLSGR
jgi:hypothetical protein